jgi:hypothetical protein
VKVRWGLVVVGVGLSVAVLSGCATQPEPAVSTPAFASEAQAFAAAEQTYRNYVDALNQVDLSDPGTFEEVYRWTTGDANAGAKESFSQMHADGWQISGSSIVTLTDRATLPTKTGSQLELAVCLDVSSIVGVDGSGNSVVSPDRRDVQSMLVTLEPVSSSPTGFSIASIDGREGSPDCGGE